MSTRRKMLAADEELANRIVEVAKRRGSTVYGTVNEILEQALRADGMGLILSDIIDTREKLEKAKSMGFTFTIEKLLYEVVEMAAEKDNGDLEKIWLETGRWYGQYFADKGGDPLDSFREAMELLALGNPVTRVEKMNGGRLSVSCVGEMFTDGFTKMQGQFIKGVVEAMGWNLVEEENKHTSKGIIRFTFEEPR